MKNGITKQRALLALAVLAVAVGLVIALTAGGGSHNRHTAARHASAHGGSAVGGAASGTGHAGSGSGSASKATTNEEAIPPRTVVASSYLGVSVAKLRAKLKQGKSLGQLADSVPGHSATGLIDALVAQRAARIDALKVPAATKRERIARYRERVELQVKRVRGSLALERDLLAASSYLEISNTRLHALVEEGQTLTAIAARTPGKSSKGLLAAIVKSREERLRSQVNEHLLDAAQAKTLKRELPGQIAAEAARKLLQSR